MGKTWQLHAVAALAGVIACAAAAAAVDMALSATSGVAAARNVTGKSDGSSYHHVWPPMQFGWRILLGSLIGFFGAAFGSVGGIFVPMLTLIIGFDPKSSTAMSKCMVMGASVSTVYYNLKLKHPTSVMPLIDYDLALLIQPMLMLGVSIGVIFNVIFSDWLVTVLLIILFLVALTKSFLKGVETWKKETIAKREAAKGMDQISLITFSNISGQEPEHATIITAEPADAADAKTPLHENVTSVLENFCWKELGLLAFVWMAFLALQIAKVRIFKSKNTINDGRVISASLIQYLAGPLVNLYGLMQKYTSSCSVLYWVLNLLQIPVSVGVSMYEAHGLMSGKRVLSSKGSQQSTLTPHQLVGGLLGLGGGFIMGPLFLELGVPPQVSSATSTFAMMFSSSMSVVEYYLLHRFPVPYAAYFAAVAFVAAIIGQRCVRRLIDWLGRASPIIFVLAFMIFVSAISLGGVGISNIVHKTERHQYMGFESLCS